MKPETDQVITRASVLITPEGTFYTEPDGKVTEVCATEIHVVTPEGYNATIIELANAYDTLEDQKGAWKWKKKKAVY